MPTGIYERTEEHKRKISGENNPFFGKHHSDESKKKMSEQKKGKTPNKGKHFSEEHKRKMSESKKGNKNFYYRKKRPDLSQKISGEKHWSWKGGLYGYLHQINGRIHLKSYCEKCGITKMMNIHLCGRNLECHNPTKEYESNDPNKWMTLCKRCHSLEQGVN